jgi:FkbM family methyltransferase
MRQYFIDLGGHDGCSIRKFRDVYDRNHKFFCITFEPNKVYKQNYKSMKKHKLYTMAAYTYDGVIKMNMDRNQGGFGSSIIMEKKDHGPGQLDRNNPDNVDCIDFSKWVKTNFKKNDYIQVKMDIEGSEYDIIEKMIEDNTIQYINKLYIEWHNKKLDIENIDERHNNLLKKLQAYNLILDNTWCAINYSNMKRKNVVNNGISSYEFFNKGLFPGMKN